MKSRIIISITSSVFLLACKSNMTEEEILTIGIEPKKTSAHYVQQIGFDNSRIALSSSVKNKKGLVLIQMPNNITDTPKMWQHETWDDFGYLGAITTDMQSNAFTAPINFVNTLENPYASFNRIFKINEVSGEMKIFCNLPIPDSTKPIVPFAVLGVYYDNHGDKLYAATVAGSTSSDENGTIYCIDPHTAKLLDSVNNIDAMALFVGGITGEKKLYIGRSRNSDIVSVELNKEGFFSGKIKEECTLEDLGPRGDDKARRIRFDKYGRMLITGVPFDYTLTANSNPLESKYMFQWNEEEKKWNFLSVE